MSARRLTFVFLVFGIFAGFGYWIFLYYTDPDNAPSVGDFWQILQSYFRKGALTVTSINPFEQDDNGDGGDYINKALRIIAGFESFSPKTYNDAGHPAIGYGHDIVPGDGFDANSIISESDGWALLKTDVENRFAPVLDYVTVELSDNQKAALISFAYNVGTGAFRNSTLLRLLNQGDVEGAAAEFAKWNHVQGAVNDGLTSRREQEQSLFLS